jgi:hypothetical protein
MCPEKVIQNDFTFSIMRDFSWLYKGAVPGWKEHDRIFTRCLRPWKTKDGWIFNAHPQAMKDALRVHIPNLPTINAIATDRSNRLSKKGGDSEQSKVVGYLNRPSKKKS